MTHLDSTAQAILEEEELDINTYEYSAPEDGMYLLFDGKSLGHW